MLKRSLPLLLALLLLTGCRNQPSQPTPTPELYFTPSAEWTQDGLDAAFRQTMSGQEHLVQDTLLLPEENSLNCVGAVLSTDLIHGAVYLTLLRSDASLAGQYALSAELSEEPEFAYDGSESFSFFVQTAAGRTCCRITCQTDETGTLLLEESWAV